MTFYARLQFISVTRKQNVTGTLHNALNLGGVGKRLQMSGFRCSEHGHRCINEGRLTAATSRCEQITHSQSSLVLL